MMMILASSRHEADGIDYIIMEDVLGKDLNQRTAQHLHSSDTQS